MPHEGSSPLLAYVEDCLPGGTAAERLALARRYGLALEVANRGRAVTAPLLDAGVRVVSVQAYRLHEFHPLHPDQEFRRMAAPHVIETLDLAASCGALHIVAVCGFGERVADRPYERCLEFFARLAAPARERGVRILLEPLSPLRAAAMTDLDEFQRMVDELDASDVFATLLDTGHLADGGHDPGEVFRTWRHPVHEVQLRGARSLPPAETDPLEAWLSDLPQPPAVVAVEHRVPIADSDLDRLLDRLRGLTYAA